MGFINIYQVSTITQRGGVKIESKIEKKVVNPTSRKSHQFPPFFLPHKFDYLLFLVVDPPLT